MRETRVRTYLSPYEHQADEADARAHGWAVSSRAVRPDGSLQVTYQRGRDTTPILVGAIILGVLGFAAFGAMRQASPTVRYERSTPRAVGQQVRFSDGTWVVGADIRPGVYRSYVQDTCYWERLSGFGGDHGDTIANDYVSIPGPIVVTIHASDAGFMSRGCGTWARS